MFRNFKITLVLLFLILILGIVFSFFSISKGAFFKPSETSFQGILELFSGLVLLSGIWAYYHYQKQKSFLLLIVLSNLLYAFYALSFNSTSSFVTSFLIINFLFVSFSIFTKRHCKFLKKHLLIDFLSSALFFLTSFLVMWLTVEKWNIVFIRWFQIANFQYGEFYNFFISAKVLDLLNNSLSIVFIYLLLKKYRLANILLFIKSLLNIIFFSGIGLLNLNLILLNLFFSFVALYLLRSYFKDKLHIVFLGPGATGKTTIINYLQASKKLKWFYFLSESASLKKRTNSQETIFEAYLKDFKKHAFRTQKYFFALRKEQIKLLQKKHFGIIDRHLFDDFLYPKVHLEMANFSLQEAALWSLEEIKYRAFLETTKEVTLVFIINCDWEIITTRRKERAMKKKHRLDEINQASLKFFSLAYSYYQGEKLQNLEREILKHAKKIYHIDNLNSQHSASKIERLIYQKFLDFL